MRTLARRFLIAPTRLALLLGALSLLVCSLAALVAPGYFYLDDNSLQYVPAFREMGRAWLSGDVPLLGSSCWNGSNLGGEFQYGLFSPLHQLLLILCSGFTPRGAATFISAVYLAVATTGFALLAVELGLETPWVVSAAFTCSFNGWLLQWGARNWVPILVTFCWLPWYWRSLKRGGKLSALTFGYMMLAGGWPFTDLMWALVTLVELVARWVEGHRRQAVGLMLGALLTAALSLPALALLVEHSSEGLRFSGIKHRGGLAFQTLAATLWPSMDDWVDDPWPLQSSFDANLGLLPAAAFVLALLRFGLPFLKRHSRLALVFGLSTALAMAPTVGGMQLPVRWFPLVLCGLSLLGHLGLQELQSQGGWRSSPVLVPGVVLTVLGLWSTFFGGNVARALLLSLPTIVVLALNHVIWVARPGWRGWVTASSTLLLLAGFTLARGHEALAFNIPESVTQTGGFEPGRRYLSCHTFADVLGDQQELDSLRPANLALESGLDFVNGYSPLRPRGLWLALDLDLEHGDSDPALATRALLGELGKDGLLASWGVDGLVFSDRFPLGAALSQAGWSQQWQHGKVRMFHRDQRSPEWLSPKQVTSTSDLESGVMALRSRRSGAPASVYTRVHAVFDHLDAARVSNLHTTRSTVSADVQTTGPAIVVFQRPFWRGYHAYLNGRELPVGVYNLALLAVELPAQAQGRLTVKFFPTSLRWSLWVALLALLASGVWAGGNRRSAVE